MSRPSFFQRMLLASPQVGFTVVLRWVTCRQYPIGPAQISGGSLNELRMRAEVFPSRARETLVPQGPAETCSWPRHRESMRPLAGSTVATAASPSTDSPKTIFPSGVQASQFAVAFISGVTLVASPPVAAIV